MHDANPVAIEPVGEALHHLRMDGAFYCRTEVTAPFGVDLPPLEGTLMFHVLAEGECYVEVPGEPPCRLRAGALGLVPHGRGHRLVSEPGAECVGLFDLPREEVSERYERLCFGGGGERTTMLCGAVRFDHPAARQLVDLLPALVRVDSWSAPEAEWLQSTLRFMASEARTMRLGGETTITRLCDVIVIQAIRSWVASAPAARTGWLGALRDDQIGRALAAVHRQPERSWTVSSLAGESRMSRSSFSSRFVDLVGEPPMRYVTRFRMQAAMSQLRGGHETASSVSNRYGYSSEAAFSRAFKRANGISPGAARRAAATLEPLPSVKSF